MTSEVNSLCPPKRQMTHENYVAARETTRLLLKEQSMVLVRDYFNNDGVALHRVLGVENSDPKDDLFYAIMCDAGPSSPMQSSFRLGVLKMFMRDGRVFRDAHGMLDALWLSWSYARDFFYVIAATIDDTTWHDICLIALHGTLPHAHTPMLLATCLHFARYLVSPGLLDAIETKFEHAERNVEQRHQLMNVDWRVFTLAAIEQRYQNGTEMRASIQAKFVATHRTRTLADATKLIKTLLPLHHSKHVTLAMVRATIPESNWRDRIVTEEGVASIYDFLQLERFDRVFYNRTPPERQPPEQQQEPQQQQSE